MSRSEMRRSTKQNQVNTRIDNFLIAVKSHKTFVIGNFHIFLLSKLFPAVVDLILKYITQGSDLKIRACIEKIDGSTGASSSATY